MCIPHLRKGKNPHILNLSPSLLMDKHWLVRHHELNRLNVYHRFAPHVGYTMAKYVFLQVHPLSINIFSET